MPSSSPRTKTVSKRRVRARSRSSTATRPGSPDGGRRDLEPRERLEQLLLRRAPPPALLERGELVEQLGDRGEASAGRAAPGRPPAARRARRRSAPSSRHDARTPSSGDGASRSSRSATSGASRRRSVSSSTRSGASTARPRSRPSTKSTPVRPIPGVRRAQEARRARGGRRRPRRTEAARAARARAAVSGKPNRRLDRVGDPETAEHGLERRAPALDGGDDHGDLLGPASRRGAAPSSSSPTSSSVPRTPAPARNRTAPSDRLLLGARLEQRPLEVGERRARRTPPSAAEAPRLDRRRARRDRRPCARSEANAARPGS